MQENATAAEYICERLLFYQKHTQKPEKYFWYSSGHFKLHLKIFIAYLCNYSLVCKRYQKTSNIWDPKKRCDNIYQNMYIGKNNKALEELRRIFYFLHKLY